MVRLSIIIPVFNVEKYIGRCIESCLRQDIPPNEYELLIVNDGSQDNSMHIVKQYGTQYDNIRIIEQENAGPSVARNRGIKEAKGEYLWFVDSDDTIMENCLGILVGKAQGKELDVLCFDIKMIEEGKRAYDYQIYSGREEVCMGIDFIVDVALLPSPCVALYKKAFLIENSLQFIVGISHEDYEFTPKSYCMARKIAYCGIAAYLYWMRSNSRQTYVPKKVKDKRSKDFLLICDSLYQFTQTSISKNTKAYKTMISRVNFAFSQSLRNYQGGYPFSEYTAKPYYPLDINAEKDRRNRWKYRLINFSIPVYLKVHRMLKCEL